MFLDNVATSRAEVVRPWSAYASLAHSLFLLRVGLAALGMVTILPLMGAVGWASVVMLRQEALLAVPMIVVVVGAGIALVLGVGLAVVDKLTKDFVVPIMWLRTAGWRTAWSEFAGLFSANAGSFVLYILFHIALSFALAIVVLIVVVCTCCLAGCLLAIPFLGTVLYLPVLVSLRAFSASYLAQFGPEFDVFTARPAGT